METTKSKKTIRPSDKTKPNRPEIPKVRLADLSTDGSELFGTTVEKEIRDLRRAARTAPLVGDYPASLIYRLYAATGSASGIGLRLGLSRARGWLLFEELKIRLRGELRRKYPVTLNKERGR